MDKLSSKGLLFFLQKMIAKISFTIDLFSGMLHQILFLHIIISLLSLLMTSFSAS